jgi:hypothetical protein
MLRRSYHRGEESGLLIARDIIDNVDHRQLLPSSFSQFNEATKVTELRVKAILQDSNSQSNIVPGRRARRVRIE